MIYCVKPARIAFALGALIGATSHSGSAQTLSSAAIRPLSVATATALLQDAASLSRLTAEAKLLDDLKPSSMTWGQHCTSAILLNEQGEFRRAVRAASMAVLIGEKERNTTALAFAKRDLAVSFLYSGQLDLAEKYANESLSHFSRDPRAVKSIAYKVLGDVWSRRRDLSKAVEFYRKAEDESDTPTTRRWIKASLASALLRSGKHEDVKGLLKEVGAYTESPLREMMLRLAAEAALVTGNVDEAIVRFRDYGDASPGRDSDYHRVWALDGVGRALHAKGDLQGAATAWIEATRIAEGVRARFRSEEIKTGLFGEMESIFSRAILALVDLGRPEEAFELAEAARARALNDQLRGRISRFESALVKPQSESVASRAQRLSQLAGASNSLLAYYFTADKGIAWVIDSNGMRVVKLQAGTDTLRPAIQQFRESIVARSPKTRELGLALHDMLVKPLGLRAANKLVVVPHDALHHLPFQALWTGRHYLVHEFSISYAPSVATLAHIALAKNASRPVRIAAFGNPDLGNEALALPGAEREVLDIKARYPDTSAFLRADATKARFLAEAPNHAQLHVAAHAQFDALDPLYSGVRLAGTKETDGTVEAHEIYGLNLASVTLVTLSACESGMTRVTRGDEVWGFTRAFLAAGAPSLVLSLWPVADESTERLMSVLYRELRGSDLREAMRKAQLEVSADSRFEHPFFWAPFTLTGDWR